MPLHHNCGAQSSLKLCREFKSETLQRATNQSEVSKLWGDQRGRKISCHDVLELVCVYVCVCCLQDVSATLSPTTCNYSVESAGVEKLLNRQFTSTFVRESSHRCMLQCDVVFPHACEAHTCRRNCVRVFMRLAGLWQRWQFKVLSVTPLHLRQLTNSHRMAVSPAKKKRAPRVDKSKICGIISSANTSTASSASCRKPWLH